MKPDVLVVGSGMYVLGKGGDDFGTILPTLATEQRGGRIGRIVICSSKLTSTKTAKKRIAALESKLACRIDVECYPDKEDDEEAYIRVLENGGNFDVAIVSVPDHLHFKIARDLLKLKLACLVVKPFTAKVAEGLELTRLAEEFSLVAGVEFHKRYDTANLLMRDILREGKIGDVLYFVVEYSQRRTIPEEVFAAWSSETNVFQYLGVHYVDLIYFVTEARPVRVSATRQQKRLKNTADSIQANIEWQLRDGDRFNSVIITNWIDPTATSAMSDQKIKVIGTKGRIESDQKNRGLQTVDDTGIEDINPYFSKIFSNESGEVTVEGYGPRSIRHFISAVSQEGDTRPVTSSVASFKEALVSTAVVEGVAASIDGRSSWIDIDTSQFAELFQ